MKSGKPKQLPKPVTMKAPAQKSMQGKTPMENKAIGNAPANKKK